jgi:hypothetical protein
MELLKPTRIVISIKENTLNKVGSKIRTSSAKYLKVRKFLGLMTLMFLLSVHSFGQTPLATETFEGTFLPTNWTKGDGGTGTLYQAVYKNTPFSDCSSYPSTTNAAIFESYNNPSGHYTWLVTPAFSLSGYTAATLSIGLINIGTNSGFIIQGSIDGGSTWQSTAIATNPTTTGSVFVTKTYSLGATYLGQSNVKIRFQLTSNFGSSRCSNDVYLDNVGVTGTLSACSGTPNAGTATITVASGWPATAFTLNSSGLSGGSGISTIWQSSPDGSTGWADISGATSA